METKESVWLFKSKKKRSPAGYLWGLVASPEPPSTGGVVGRSPSPGPGPAAVRRSFVYSLSVVELHHIQ